MGNILGKTIALSISICLILTVQAQDKSRDLVREGNTYYQEGNYADADKKYGEAAELNPELTEAMFNKADALFQQGDFENAAKGFNSVASSARDKETQAAAFHNLGNTLMKTENYQGSIEAYKQALRRNPQDEDTRYNLSYAMQKLREQQQQEQQNQENKDQEKEDKKENKDQEQQENQKGKGDNQEDKDEKDKQDNGDNKGEQKPDENEPEGSKPEEGNQKPEEQQKPNEMSKADAERLLKALQNNERNTQEKVNAKRVKVKGKNIEKDW